MAKRILILSFFIFIADFSVYTQTKGTDSLIVILNNTQNINEKIEILLNLSENLKKEYNYKESVSYSEKGLLLSKELKNITLKNSFLKLSAENYYLLSDFNNSFKYYKHLYQSAKKTHDKHYEGIALTGLLKNYWRQGLYKKAIFSGTQAIQIFENLNDTTNTRLAKISLAAVYIDLKKYKDAEKIYDKLLCEKYNLKDSLLIADIYEKKGVLKFHKQLYPYARSYYKKAFHLYSIKNNKLSAAVELGNIGETYEMEGDYDKAVKFYKEALKTETELQYYSGLIFLHEAIGRTYFKLKKYHKAKQSYEKALSYIEITGENRELTNICDMIHTLHAKTGNYKKAYLLALSVMQLKDSLTGEKVRNEINKLKIKYETEKTEKENQILKSKQEYQKTKNIRQFWIIIIISILFFLILIFAVLLFRINAKNKKIRIILGEKNKKLDEAYTNLKQNIDYAGKIQNAMLKSYIETLKVFSEFIILYKPAYTLSGDFYWSKKIKDTIFVAVADSTGHGISGALLSITGMSFLNEIVTEDFIQTDVILNNLRSKIKYRLNQKGDFYEQKDGWDIALFSFNLKTLRGQYSGAFNSLYVISEKNNIKTVTKYKADRQPVGVYYHEHPFKHQNFQIKKDDIIWLFTDGYADQYNESGRKKYSSKRLRELLLSISNEPLSKQKIILTSELKNWQGTFEQVDDILIFGTKI